MEIKTETYLILGITPAGRPFRPSDWAERLCGILARFDNKGRWVYSEYAQPVIHEGLTGVKVNTALQNLNSSAYEFMMNFAEDNRLKVIADRKIIYINQFITRQDNVSSLRKQTAS
ncbi:MAG: DUF3579 domain-containing protein [Nitrosomonas sp. PRO4]|nr:DUF3579 domain-containing protein [Nitrosomonas sp. PRO4]